MQRAARGYTTLSGLDAASPRENEIVAFTLCNREMAAAADPLARARALHRNHQLWSLIVKDVSMEANGLPQPLKRSLTELGLWAMAYSLKATASDLPLEPLIQVNTDMIEGLRAQAGAAPAASVAAAAPAPLAAPMTA